MAIENVRSDPLFDPATRYSSGQSTDITTVGNPLDNDASRKLHGRCMNGYLYERRRQAGNRYQMALDHDYYDTIQLTDEDIAELTDRGQPLYVYNLVKRTADWVIGTEKRTRIDFKVLARNKDANEVEAARNKTDLLKYFSDINKAPFHRSQAFKETVISGLGWLENGANADPEDEVIYSRKESWRNILHDSHALELDGTDMSYLYRFKWTDLEVAQAMFPNRKDQLESATVNGMQADDEDSNEYYLGNRISGQDYMVGQAGRYPTTNFSGFLDNSRDRVKLIECWYRKPVLDKLVMAKQLPLMHGQRYNPANDDMRHAVLIGDASIIDRVRMGVYYAIMTEGHMLAMGRSPYRHNQFPFTPIWCYRRGRDNAPYGLIRPIRDPQDGFNARMRKALFALSAYRVEATSDAIDTKVMDWEDIRREAGRPDALLVRKKGGEMTVHQDHDLAEGHMKMAEMDASLILDSSGITADNLGMDSNAQSGKAIIAKQSEGSAVTAEIFDNARFAYQLSGEKELSLTEQYVTDERVVRVTDRRGRPTWKKVNEIVQNPDGSVRVLNDIASTKADFVIDEADFNVSLRQQASQQLFDFAGKMQGFDPMIVLQIMDMAVDQSNLPDKDELLKRIRSITGYQSPEDAVTPQEQQQQQQAKEQQIAQQQEQKQRQDQAADAEVQVQIADAELKRSQADQARAEAERARNELQKGASVLTPEEEARIQQLNEDHANAMQALQEHQGTIRDLQGQLANRQAEITAKAETDRHQANQVRAAAEHAANMTHAAAVHATNTENAAQPPEQDETVADTVQAVEELRNELADLAKRVDAGETSEAEAMKGLTEKIDQVLKAIKKPGA